MAHDKKTGRASDAYKEGMLTALRTNFRQVSNILQEGVDADGGYLVPEEYDSRLIRVLEGENIMRKLGHKITTSGDHKINIASTEPAAAWIEEGGALQFSDAKFAQILLDAHKLHVAIKVTEELLYDNAFNLENYIIEEFGKALSNAEEDAFLNGTGVGQPLGLFAATGGGTVYKTVTKLTADDIMNLVYALKRPYRKNSAFIMNDQIIATIRTFKDGNGVCGSLLIRLVNRISFLDILFTLLLLHLKMRFPSVITATTTLATVVLVLSSSLLSFLLETV